jgi:hypothetical protein
MKTGRQLLAIATMFVLAGCAAPVGQVIVVRKAEAAPIGVREYKVVFDTSTDATHATRFNVNGGTWRNVPCGILPVTAGLHTWTFDAISANDTDPPAQKVSIEGGERVVFRVRYQ